MCGIFFIASKQTIDLDICKINSLKIKHRGPDNTKHIQLNIEDYFIYTEFHRLSINGIDEKSNQPINIDGLYLLCNGEIYNYKQLAIDHDIKLTTNSDCEIILHLYIKFGYSMIDLLDGVFAFIIIDTNKSKIMIGHDPFGIRPIYIGYDLDTIIISSELKSIKNIKNLNKIDLYKPGHFSIYDLKQNIKKPIIYNQYYNFIYHDNKITDELELTRNIQTKLYNSVYKRLTGDREIGCLLSGGLDSSIITLISCQILGPKNVNTFSIGLKDSPDMLAANNVSEYLGTNHTSIEITEKDITDSIEETIYQIESNDVTTIRASIPMFLLSKYIRDNTNIKVILSGEGSDEASGSYLYFHNAPNPVDFQEECIRLLKDVYMFDVLRGDKTTAGSGLEIRVPFFDKEFMNFYMSINPEYKIIRNGYEKYLLRKTYEEYLPKDIVWRRKEGFSDGVSKLNKPLYQIIEEHTIQRYKMLEKNYYDYIFNKYYGNYTYIIPYQWLPKWSGHIDNPSGRLLMSLF